MDRLAIGPVSLCWHRAAAIVEAPAAHWPTVLDALRAAGLVCAATVLPESGRGRIDVRPAAGQLDVELLHRTVAAAVGIAEPVVEPVPEELPSAPTGERGHWPKGRSRNLDPHRVAAARNLTDLCRRAIDAHWRHPRHGTLTLARVAERLRVQSSTLNKWLRGRNLPPLWVVDALRDLLEDYRP